MKTIIKYFLLVGVLSSSLKSEAQSDNYNWSFKFGGTPFSYIVNNGATYDWYGNSKGGEILLGLGYKNFHINTSFRYFGNAIKKNLLYDNTNFYLPKGAGVRMVFWNISLSYEKEIINRFFIEPNIGFLRNYTTTNIIDFGGNEFDIKDLYGLTLGTNLIKYIKFPNGFYLGFYISCNYNLIDYQKWNSELKNNSLGYSIGVILKGVDEKKKKVHFF